MKCDISIVAPLFSNEREMVWPTYRANSLIDCFLDDILPCSSEHSLIGYSTYWFHLPFYIYIFLTYDSPFPWTDDYPDPLIK